jgi:hypothetical protein
VAALPAGQPGVRPPGDGPVARPQRRDALRTVALVAFSALCGLNVATYAGVEGPGAVDDVARAALACVALFGVCGFGVTRLALPDVLRAHEWLWVLPVGACAAALELALLGYLRVSLWASLVVLGVANVALAVVAVRRHGPPPRPASTGALAWPLWIAVLLACVALVPTFRAGVATVQGYGSDAHLAAGTAHLLKHHHPGAVAVEEPVDRVPLVWRSKPPIYYPMAAVSLLSGMATWEVFATVVATLVALAALGFFLLARDALGAGLLGAGAAMAVVGLDRVVLQTAMHPYYNQLWGFFTLPFALLLAWRRAYALLALFLLVGAFAYPLALPIPLLALAVMLWPERRRLRGLWRRWMLLPALVLLVPLWGVLEKAASAVRPVVDPGMSLAAWGGDLLHFVPEHQFVGMPSTSALVVLGPVLLVAIAWELRAQPRALAIALGAVLVFGALAAVWFRQRDVGWYFHFKALAFVGPLAVLLAAVAVSRLPRLAWPALLALVVLGVQGARDEMAVTFDQTPRPMTALRSVDARLPPGASVRLDMDPNEQLWGAYFLAGQRTCSLQPLTNTSYPHVPASRRADYAVVDHRDTPRPVDAIGAPLWRGEWFTLYRLRANTPGVDRCSQRAVQTVTSVPIT